MGLRSQKDQKRWSTRNRRPKPAHQSWRLGVSAHVARLQGPGKKKYIYIYGQYLGDLPARKEEMSFFFNFISAMKRLT